MYACSVLSKQDTKYMLRMLVTVIQSNTNGLIPRHQSFFLKYEEKIEIHDLVFEISTRLFFIRL